MGQPKASKPGNLHVTPRSYCYSCVFIKNLINDKSKHKKKNVTMVTNILVLYCHVPLTFIYNMYNVSCTDFISL